jgi:hypothetical protein
LELITHDISSSAAPSLDLEERVKKQVERVRYNENQNECVSARQRSACMYVHAAQVLLQIDWQLGGDSLFWIMTERSISGPCTGISAKLLVDSVQWR